MSARGLALFDDLLDCDADERTRRLANIAREDADLAATLRRWLDADLKAAAVPEDPAHFAALLAEEESEMPADGRIGPYRLLRELGRGGMGAVWLAERADGQFEQRVALKLIKRGMDSRAIQRRFLAERQILARLEHPNIARLMDGGIAADGRPYFALEYVDGVPLLEFADKNICDLRERLNLFIKLCAAVAYAHSQLVVHRDLKPSNILVESNGNPKLLDFGIAKALADESGVDPTQTAPEQRYLTRAYAAPEQWLGAPVSTATDVYALGLVLFELLAGTRASSESQTHTQERPSQARERNGASNPTGIRARDLKGDLDTIVMRALAAEPTRRYSSAQALADDLSRYLDGKPVLARADSAGYRIGKFVQRHRVGVVIGCAAVLALLIGSGVALWQAQRAQAQAARATAVLGFVEGLFEGADPAVAKGNTITARELLDRGAQRVDSDFAQQGELAAELKHTIGRLYLKLGLFDRAQTELDAALELAPATDSVSSELRFWRLLDRARVDHAVGTSDAGVRRLDEAQVLASRATSLGVGAQIALTGLRAQLLHLRGDDTQALDAARKAYETAAAAYGAEGRDALDATEAYAELLDSAGHDRDALPLLERVASARNALLGADDPRTLRANANLSDTLRDVDQLERATALGKDVLQRRRRVLGEHHPDTARSWFQLGELYHTAGNYPDADAALDQAIALLRKLEPTDRNLLTTAIYTKATNDYFQDRADAAEQGYRESGALSTELYGPDHRDSLSSQMALAQVLRGKGQMAEAISLLRHVVEVRARIGGDTPERVESLRIFGDVLSANGEHAEAIDLLSSAADMALRLYGERHQMPQQTRVLLGRAYLNSGDAQQAAAVIAPALAALRAMYPQGHPDIARTQGYLARIELRLGHADQANDLARQQYDFLHAQFPDADNPRVAEAEGLWGECQMAAGQRESGRRSIEHALAVLAKAQPEHPQLSAWRGLLKPK